MAAPEFELSDFLFPIFIGGLVAWFAMAYWRNRQRTMRGDRFLLANGFKESSLPGYFPKGLLPDSLTNGSVQRCWTGMYRGHSGVVGEVRVPSGEDYYDQTFVAVEQPTAERYAVPPLIRSLEVQFVQNGRWVIGTIDRHAMDVEAIEGYLACFT